MELYVGEHEPIFFSLVLFDIRGASRRGFFISRNKNCPLCRRRLPKFHAELPVIENILFSQKLFSCFITLQILLKRYMGLNKRKEITGRRSNYNAIFFRLKSIPSYQRRSHAWWAKDFFAEKLFRSTWNIFCFRL